MFQSPPTSYIIVLTINHHHYPIINHGIHMPYLPSGYVKIAIENGPVEPAVINPLIGIYIHITIIAWWLPFLSQKKPTATSAPGADCQQLKACRACCVLPERCASPPASTSSTDGAEAARARRAAAAQPELPEPMTMKS